ncbi:hypothetical protein PQ472_05035 [Lacticaseibacillus pabuli]|uniref:Uncharacterized protein n=1 Tax=Lacticaseibacillus pabuli TaxID=3025672 RepID=A0ABY7WX73_9LACO|nr:hypothetical protein [Lacticaseibacillus sp. KACC 23028]WDF83601.1 hypothetical protein PQ472_05035 [Lacticaseibacillus sp. KACC 23028]
MMQAPEIIIQPDDMLVWQNDDIIKRLHGITRQVWDQFVKRHMDELTDIGAIVRKGKSSGVATKYRVSVMRPWLDIHLEELFGGQS